jgi:hypothetical protein
MLLAGRRVSANDLSREERWKSEGIQVGGVRSSRGVLGHWFDKFVSSFPLVRPNIMTIPNPNRDHDHHGPAGPTAFWKVSNEIDDSPADDLDDADDEGDAAYEEEAEGDEVEEEEIDIANLNVEQIIAVLGAIGGAN